MEKPWSWKAKDFHWTALLPRWLEAASSAKRLRPCAATAASPHSQANPPKSSPERQLELAMAQRSYESPTMPREHNATRAPRAPTNCAYVDKTAQFDTCLTKRWHAPTYALATHLLCKDWASAQNAYVQTCAQNMYAGGLGVNIEHTPPQIIFMYVRTYFRTCVRTYVRTYVRMSVHVRSFAFDLFAWLLSTEQRINLVSSKVQTYVRRLCVSNIRNPQTQIAANCKLLAGAWTIQPSKHNSKFDVCVSCVHLHPYVLHGLGSIWLRVHAHT